MAGENNSTFGNSTDSTTDDRANWPEWKKGIAAFYPYVPTMILVVVMLAMGCAVKLRDVWNHYKRPVGVAIGAGSQFILFPLMAFGFAHAFGLPPAQALGLLIAACCPGGTTSNIYAYYVNGDLPLSICMTVTATVLALGMMPLNLFIYSRSWTSANIRIPYERIAITLASILIPVVVGMFIHWKFEKISNIISKIGAVFGLLLIVLITTFQAIMYPYVFTVYWKVWLVSVLLPYCGFIIGYLFAWICRQNRVLCRTIAIETGIQNVGVAFTVIALSYEGALQAEINVVPILSGIFVTIGGLTCVFIYRISVCICGKQETLKDGEDTDEKDTDKEKATEASNSATVVSKQVQENGEKNTGLDNVAFDKSP